MKGFQQLRNRRGAFVLSFLALCVAGGGLAGTYFARTSDRAETGDRAIHATYRVGDHGALLPADGSVAIYTMATCQASQDAKRWLVDHRVRHIERAVDRSEQALADAKALGAARTPFLLIGKYQLEGFDPDVTQQLLAEEGIVATAAHRASATGTAKP